LGSKQEAASVERPRKHSTIPISPDKEQSFCGSSTDTELARATQIITTRKLSK
jgi:hypothetical protein